jgi:signal transduction histidine kinase
VRQLEQRTRSAERLADLGTMTGGLAHEIKNPLSTLGLNIQLIREDLGDLVQTLPPDAPQREPLSRTGRRVDGLHREAQRLRGILEDFLRFAGRVKLDIQPTDLHAVCEELIDFFQPQADEARVRLRADLRASPSVAPADASLLKQALLNLLINACQAMGEARDEKATSGGNADLMIRSENTELHDAPAIALHVTDTGPGISPESATRIFEPYYSTKRGGTGLGLPTTRRIVEEHGGTLTLHSAPGQGTSFTITLPTGEPGAGVARRKRRG